MPENVFCDLNNLKIYKNSITAFVTDVDGTLSEIVPEPDAAIIDDDILDLLNIMKNKFQLLVFITGRTIKNVRNMINIPGALYVGNHGMEYQKNSKIISDPQTSHFKTEIGEIEKKLRNNLNLSGIIFENKKTSLTIHYRMHKNQEMARISILNEIKLLNISKEFKISEGKKIIEIKPLSGNNKGTIIHRIVEDYKIKQMIYCGDDITDIDAFKAIELLNLKTSFKGISIAVLSNETPSSVLDNAHYYVNSIQELKSFIKWLLDK